MIHRDLKHANIKANADCVVKVLTNSNKRQFPVKGGFAPCWRDDGKELFYLK